MAHHDNLDHRCIDSNTSQDPTSMTIEFLRARLLAERAVSKSARSKLDGLADKVAELEEELKIVSLQRKKAEQATADILAILEENGFTDVSDSNSDHETYSHTNSVSGKTISWKGRRREPTSSDKINDFRTRRQTSFDSAYFSSSRHHQGRSCRQIRRRESRNASEDHKRDGNPVDFQDNGEMLPKTSQEASTTVVLDDTGDKSLHKLSNPNGLEKKNSMDINLESALVNRAQVIGSSVHMEDTQKEWEQNFRDNKSALDLCDIGNHSDVTDESNGEKTQPQLQGAPVDSRSVANEVERKESFGILLHGSPDNSADKCCKSCASNSVEQDASAFEDKGKRISESPKSECSRPQSGDKGIYEHSSSTTRSPPVTRPNSSSATTIQKVDYPLVPVAKEKSDTFDTVLTALQQAKLSLQEKVNSLHIRKPEYLSESSYPSTPGSYALPIEPAKSSLPNSRTGSLVEFPVGCAGLFRVPTDFSPDASKRNNFLALSSQKALVSQVSERGSPLLRGDNLLATSNLLNAGFQSQLLDTSPPLSMDDDRPLTTPYIGGPKLWAGFKADGQESRLYNGKPSVSGSAISGRIAGSEGNQVSSTSFNLDRQVSTYAPMTTTPTLYPDSVMRSREMYSTPYYTRPVGLPPTGESGEGLFRRV